MTTYKPITESDIATIVEMMCQFYAIDDYPMDVKGSELLFSEFINHENLGKAWLILSGKEAVGYVILTYVFSFEYGGRIAFLDELFVSEMARGTGIGKNTIAFIKEEAIRLGLKLIYLEVEPHNDKAQQLYLSEGFENHKRNLMRYKINNKN